MSNILYTKDDDFLNLMGFGGNNFLTPTVTNTLSQQFQEEVDTSEGEEISEEDEVVCDYQTDDDTLEQDGDLSREMLQYDVEEMYEWRATNRTLRRTQLSRTWPQESEINFPEFTPEPLQQNTLNRDDRNESGQPSSRWPRFFTTYEGGYESEQRESDDEGNRLSDDESDVDLPIQKRRKMVVYPMFNEKSDMKNVELTVGLRFISRKVFKEAILAYSIQQHKDLIYLKNDKKRMYVGCSLCKWELKSAPDLEDVTAWQIKSMQPIHDCLRTMKNRLITKNWLVQEYLDRILRNPLMSPTEIKDDMKARYVIRISSRKCQRAKEKALNAVTTLMQKQYGILKPYLLELVKSNPGTTCVLKTLQGELGQPKIFQRFYVCFNALKKTFLETCRPIFGLDGCFLKHACGGQLLCAVGRDGNNQMFPIAWAIVERENRSSWEWFCKLLMEDLKMEDGDGWTVISDQQKGLIDAIGSLWPNAEHRNCARHIYSN